MQIFNTSSQGKLFFMLRSNQVNYYYCSKKNKQFINITINFLLFKGFESIVDTLIKHHADVNIIDKNGDSPLYIAFKKGNRKYKILKKVQKPN